MDALQSFFFMLVVVQGERGSLRRKGIGNTTSGCKALRQCLISRRSHGCRYASERGSLDLCNDGEGWEKSISTCFCFWGGVSIGRLRTWFGYPRETDVSGELWLERILDKYD